MKTAEFLGLVKARIEPARDPLEAACWFFAWQDAEGLRDLNMRELAELARDGSKGIQTEEDVQTYLDSWFEDTDRVEAHEHLIESLNTFFRGE